MHVENLFLGLPLWGLDWLKTGRGGGVKGGLSPLCSGYIWHVIAWSSVSLKIQRASMSSLYLSHRSMGGMEASISIADMFVVWKALVIILRHLFCIIVSVFNILPFLEHQKVGSPCVAMCRIAPMYS